MLYLARHAQPLIAAGTCYGQLDVAADAIATHQAAQALAAVLPPKTVVISSTLQRCEQLSNEIRRLQPDLTYKTDQNLQEMHFGNWEGRLWADIAPSELADWTADFAHYRVGRLGGSLAGESVSQFMARVALSFDALTCAKPVHPTLWITHAGVIRAAGLLARGMRHVNDAKDWPVDAPAFGQWCTLGAYPNLSTIAAPTALI